MHQTNADLNGRNKDITGDYSANYSTYSNVQYDLVAPASTTRPTLPAVRKQQTSPSSTPRREAPTDDDDDGDDDDGADSGGSGGTAPAAPQRPTPAPKSTPTYDNSQWCTSRHRAEGQTWRQWRYRDWTRRRCGTTFNAGNNGSCSGWGRTYPYHWGTDD